MADTEFTDQDVLNRLVKGDKSALQILFNNYYTDLVRFGIKYVKNHEISEELVQEVFINIWERHQSLVITSSLKSYLFTSVKYRAFNYLRLQMPKEKLMENIELLDTFANTEDYQVSPELKKEVSKAIDSLPTKCRAILIMSKMDGMSHREIAKELGVSEKTVENQITIAFKKLRVALEPIRYNLLTISWLLVATNYIWILLRGNVFFC
jgi:RNA polymerase sigma-70 factor (ECF subfamily)